MTCDLQFKSCVSVPGSPTKSTPHQNGYTFTITDYPAKYLSKSPSKFPPHSNSEPNCHQLKPDSLPYILPVHNQTLQTPRGVAPLQPPAATNTCQEGIQIQASERTNPTKVLHLPLVLYRRAPLHL